MSICRYGDPTCPCQDGDSCHYEDAGDSPAWPIVGAGPFAGWAVERVRVLHRRVHELTTVEPPPP